MPKTAPTILILGASGRVGRLLAGAWAQSDRSGARFLFQHRRAEMQDTAGHIFCDIQTDPRPLESAGPIDFLVNLAGITPPAPEPEMAQNARLARVALDLAARLGVPNTLLASSAAVYGAPPPGVILAETRLPAPAGAYGRAKAEMERMAAARHGPVKVTTLRIANVAGADVLLLNALAATPGRPLCLDVFGGGRSPLRSYIGPKTLLEVLVSLACKAGSGIELPPVLNVATPRPVFMADLLKELAAQGQPVAVKRVRAGPKAIPEVVLDTARLERLHGFRPTDSAPAEMIGQVLAARGAP